MREIKTASFLKQFSIQIQMTPAELDWADWAIDPEWEYWCTEDGAWERGEDEIYTEQQIPQINGNILILSDIYDINEDLLYRLEEQAHDVSQTDADSGQQINARYRSAKNLSSKIREQLGI
jgi:spore coat polysaccharide biosynthesis predicted glycosyltransferase SpsG